MGQVVVNLIRFFFFFFFVFFFFFFVLFCFEFMDNGKWCGEGVYLI